MTHTASPRRLPSTFAATTMVDLSKAYGSGDNALRALGPTILGVA